MVFQDENCKVSKRRRFPMKLYKKYSGFSLIEVMVVIGVSSIVLGLAGTYYLSTFKSQNYFLEKGNAEILRERIIRIMQDDIAWKKTIEDTTYNSSANFNCLVAETDCSALSATQTAFTPKSADNQLFMNTYNSLNSSHGFTSSGVPCTGFTTAVAGSPNCPMRYTFTWSPLCPPLPATCAKPQIVITGTFSYNKGPSAVKLNQSSMSFVIYRGFSDDMVLKKTCEDIMNGVYDSVTKVCSLGYANFTCPFGRVVTGMVNGVPQCTVAAVPPPPPPPPPPPCCSAKGAPPVCDTSC